MSSVDSADTVETEEDLLPPAAEVQGWRVSLEKELENYEALDYLQKQFQMPKFKIFVILLSTLALSFIMGLSVPNFCLLVAYVAPAYLTVRALTQTETADYKHWITYWVIFSFLGIFEGVVLTRFQHVFPFYYAFKLGFSIWCQSRHYRGSIFVYSHVLAPFLKSHAAVLTKT